VFYGLGLKSFKSDASLAPQSGGHYAFVAGSSEATVIFGTDRLV
jgi:hypothetical protein